MKQKVRFGIIGILLPINLFKRHHCEAFELSTVYSRTEARGQAFAAKYGVKHIFTDLEELLTSDVVDAMSIASPNALHAKQA